MPEVIEQYFFRRIKSIDPEPSGPHLLLIVTVWKKRLTTTEDEVEDDREIVASEIINEPIGTADPEYLFRSKASASCELDYTEYKKLLALHEQNVKAFILAEPEGVQKA